MMKRLTIVVALSTACANQPQQPAAPPPDPPAVNVVELSAADASARMAKGELTSEALTAAYLKRISEVDDAGPMLSSVIEVNDQADDEARARDAERTAGKVRGPLHGIPVLIKDNID